MQSIDDILAELSRNSQETFRAQRRILDFNGFLRLLLERPYSLTRTAPQYLVDAMDHYGVREVRGPAGPVRRFCIFDDPLGGGERPVVGQEVTQNAVYRHLREFIRKRQTDRMILLHGPNGSAKTTFVHALMRGLHAYGDTEEGLLFRFNWVFAESVGQSGTRLGFDSRRDDPEDESLALIEADRISAKIPCEMSDNPVFLLPAGDRMRLLEQALPTAPEFERNRFVRTRRLVDGRLSPKSQRIYDSLLKAYQGDWRRVIRHVQVERWRIDRRARDGAVTIEPQGNIDAQSRQLAHSTMNGLPAVLQNEALFEAQGDLIDGNRGVIEYSDFLKRSIEANKYLLTTAEDGVINLPSYTAWIDAVLIGTSNENYLAAFRRDPLFTSFSARLAMVRVPYLLRVSQEEELYRRELARLPAHVRVAPHTTRVAALWAVMTRLVEPIGTGLEDDVRRVVEKLSPIEKARLYDTGEAPSRLNDADRTRLLSHLPEIASEFDGMEEEFEGLWDAAYEGRRGCSAREMLALVAEIALDPPGGCVTPLHVLRMLPELVKDPGLFQFLRIKRSRNGYHDVRGFIEAARRSYLDLVRDDVERAAQLVDETEYKRLFERYFRNVRAYKTKEKVLDEATGRTMPPDDRLLQRVESLLEVGDKFESFRSDLLTQAASFKLDNPTKPMVHEVVFADLFRRLRENAFRERFERVRQIVGDALVVLGVLAGTFDSERRQEAERLIEGMRKIDYCDWSLREALEFFFRNLDSLINPSTPTR